MGPCTDKINDSGGGEKDREKEYTEYCPVGLFLLAAGLKQTQTNGCSDTVKQIMEHKECDSALHRSSLHTELGLEGLPCLWLPPNCAQPSGTFVPCSTKCSGNGSESAGELHFRVLCPWSLRSWLVYSSPPFTSTIPVLPLSSLMLFLF